MSRYHISVAPVAGGWSLACDAGLQPLMFLSGARAEAQARALARRLSLAGDEVQVLVHDGERNLVGVTDYVAAPEPRCDLTPA